MIPCKKTMSAAKGKLQPMNFSIIGKATHWMIPKKAKGMNTRLYLRVFSMYIPMTPALTIPTNIIMAAKQLTSSEEKP